MASKFKPGEADLRAACESVERSEKKFRRWREEYRVYEGFYDNYESTYNANSATGYEGPGRNASTIVTRNAVGANVYSEVRRFCPTSIRFEATPEISAISVESEMGPVLVDGESAAYAQAEIATYGFRAISFLEQFTPVVENSRIANEGWMKIVTWDGGAAPETTAYVEDYSGGGAGEETGAKRVKPHKPMNSLAGGRFPGWIWVSVDDVIVDADAVMDNEVNSITHRVVQPLRSMKSQEVDDYEMVLNPETRKLERVPVMDPETGEVKRVKKFMNLDKVKGNYKFYLGKQSGQMHKKGDFRNDPDPLAMTDGDVDDYVVHFERNQKFSADSETVIREFGGVPDTIDGYVYHIMDYVEDCTGSGDGPVLIRSCWYPVDMGSFALIRLKGRPKAGSQKGFSAIRNYWESMQLSNYLMSQKMSWLSTIKPVHIIDKDIIEADTWKQAQNSETNSAVFVTKSKMQDLRMSVYTTPSNEPPQSLDVMDAQLRGIQDEAVGYSANQRLQTSGNQSATQSSIIDKNADIQTAFEIETVKAFIEKAAKIFIRVFRATLPKSGRFEIPGSDKAFVQWDVNMLHLESAFRMDYAGFSQTPNPVQTKQLEQLIQQIQMTPPQMWPLMRPMWAVQSSQFTPAVMAAYRKFEKLAFATKSDSDPAREHNVLREGIMIKPDTEENFVDTIPQHDKMLKEITTNPQFAGWNEPQKNGAIPMKLLIAHIAMSKRIAMDKGMGPALGLSGDEKGAQRKERGSGPASGRMSQDMAPEAGDIEAGASSVPMPMEA